MWVEFKELFLKFMFASRCTALYIEKNRKRAFERSTEALRKRQGETHSRFLCLQLYFQTRFFILCKISLIKNGED